MTKNKPIKTTVPTSLPSTKSADNLRIVTSAHLAASYPELSEFEFGLIIASNAFRSWLIRCMNAAGAKDMAVLDVLILHHVTHRDKEKRLADICFILNIEDTHVASYSLKKLVAAGLVRSEKKGKEMFYSTTPEGTALCNRYKEVRENCLVSSFSKTGDEKKQLADMAKFLRNLSGLYDQASRGASSY
ncbi:MAG: transcriptional regulator [Deltaproteobacteria bacterium]|nr:MAG: transcriptional regulator [Deltaproteobacteria bacterium]RLB78837.1 MAG: transcriptional regulator [Deltaproteobacteria bacterium]